jgi:hypothetical protein
MPHLTPLEGLVDALLKAISPNHILAGFKMLCTNPIPVDCSVEADGFP